MTIEKLMELHAKAHEIKSRRPVELATGLKGVYTEGIQKIKSNKDLSDHGRYKAREALQKDLRKQTLQEAAKVKADYLAVVKEARQLAYDMQVKEHEKPSDAVQVALYERSLADLKTAVMLGANAERSIEAITAFVSKYGDDPYYADQIKQQYSTLAGSVLGIEATQSNRTALAHVLERIETKATTPERDAASQIIEAFEGAETRNLFLTGTAVQNSIAGIIGTGGNRLNDADAALAEMDAQPTE